LKRGIATKDWFVASALFLIFVISMLAGAAFLQNSEQVLYDAGVSLTNRQPGAAERVAIIAIDDQSIDQIGRWPWSRNVHAQMLEKLSKARTRVVGMQVFLTEAQDGDALTTLRSLKSYLRSNPVRNRSQQNKIYGMVRSVETVLDADNRLAKALPLRKNVVMPMFFNIHPPLGNPDGKLPGFVTSNRLTEVTSSVDSTAKPFETNAVRYPLEIFGSQTTGIGHQNAANDSDGGIRSELLVLDHYGEYYPSLALLLAAKSLNLRPRQINVDLDKGTVNLGKLSIKTDNRLRMYTGFYKGKDGRPAFDTYSFADVMNNKVPLSIFNNRIVIIGSTAVGVGNRRVTPVDENMAEPELTANIVASILNQDFYVRPGWSQYGELLLLVVVWGYLALVLPRFSAGVSAFVSLTLFIAFLGSGLILILSQKVWLQTVTPALLLVVGHLVLTTKGFLTAERQRASAQSDSAETNRMLGLTFQSQGQLDMAMDKFRKLPVDTSVLELIYNLALDFERKRQFNKASAAYDYIISHNSKFRDVKEKKARAQQVDGTIIMGGGRGGMAGAGTVILDAGGEKPTLGRYMVEKELGRGAMGIVYLGRDPKINRTVAIKTLDLSSEFEPSEIQGVKDRFFREAETAGRLNHPGIVTIFDAGEEHDLAYIAMEFLEGRDLSDVLQEQKTTKPEWVLHIISEAADALDYAHRQDVVHRDIKPANIMYNENDDTIKITDFGIARITASNRTKTGVVLGTPSYMSPEQLSGKHIDGRSDLFSLGVMMFEMLTKTQPFGGDSLASLMYQITNEKHPDINKLRDDLPKCIKPIIDKALQKDPNKRFQSGAEFKEAVDRCWESF